MDLVKRWEETIGSEADAARLPCEATYRPSAWESAAFATASEHGDTRTLQGGAFLPDASGGPRFELGEEIGRGGMGVVHRALQTSLQRDVALKMARLLPAGSSMERMSRQRVGFLAEAYAMGSLEHPNIVPIHDLGSDGDGHVFLAMKLVGGEAWKETLIAKPSELELHLGILIQVCNAVAFAHSRGIVHNDIKPSNVMLGTFGEVLLMDWGLAVSFHERQVGPFHRDRSCIVAPCGTPAYSPPELARGEGEKVGPATDVYLLGATLYEILAGVPPHRHADFFDAVRSAARGTPPPLPASAPGELRALVRRAMAPEPERRCATARVFQAALQDFLRHRQSLRIADDARERLARCRTRARPGLAEEERNRLYEDFATSVAGFAQARRLWPRNPGARVGERAARLAYAEAALQLGDLGLSASQLAQAEEIPEEAEEAGEAGEAEPVEDPPEAARLRARLGAERTRRSAARRAARRTRVALAGALATLVLGLTLGLLSIRAEAARTQRARDVAMDALEKLTFEAQESLQREAGTRSANRAAQRLLRTALEGWQQLREAAVSEQDISLSSGIARLQTGRLALSVDGDLATAEREVGAAVTIFTALVGDFPGDRRYRHNLAYALRSHGHVLAAAGRKAAAIARFDEALVLHRALVAEETTAQSLRGLSATLDALGRVALAEGEAERARACYEEALAIDRTLLTEGDPREARHNLQLGLSRLGDLYRAAGERERARACYTESHGLARALFDEAPHDASARADLLYVTQALAGLARDEGRIAAAEQRGREALRLARELYERDPLSFRAGADLCDALSRLGGLVRDEGRLEEAAELFGEGLARARALYERSPALEEAGEGYARALRDRAGLHDLARELDQAAALWDEIIALARQRVAVAPSFRVRRRLLNGLSERGTLALSGGALPRAEALFDEALQLARALVATDSAGIETALDLCTLLVESARVAQRQGRLAEARSMLEEATTKARGLLARDPEDLRALAQLLKALGEVGEGFFLAGDFEAARTILAEAADLLDRTRRELPNNTLLMEREMQVLGLLGKTLTALTEPGEAIAVFEASLALARKLDERFQSAASQRELAISCYSLAVAHEAAGQLDAALALLDEARPLQEGLADSPDADALVRHDLSLSLGMSAVILRARGQPAEAEARLEAAATIQRALVAEDPGNAVVTTDLSKTLFLLADLHDDRRDSAGAFALLDEAVANQSRIVAAAPHTQPQLTFLRQRRRQAGLLAGNITPANLSDQIGLAVGLAERGDHAEAYGAFAVAMAAPEVAEDGHLHLYAARCAGRAFSVVPADRAEDVAASCLRWLGLCVSQVRESLALADGPEDREERAALLGLLEEWKHDPAFAALRGREAFAALFEED